MASTKVCAVTGGGGGIGSGILFSMIRSGFKKFAIVDIDPKKAKAVAKECREKGAEDVIVIIQDLSKVEEACPKVIQDVVEHFGRLDILVNNAAIVYEAMFCDITTQDMIEVMNINFVSPFALTREALPHIRKEKGNIIFISSIGAKIHGPKLTSYAASKAALDKMAKNLAFEEASKEVRVNVVSPGPILTDMMRQHAKVLVGREVPDAQITGMMSKMQPLRRMGMPEHIGDTVAFLVNDEVSYYTTGVDIQVDGGTMLGGSGKQRAKR